ncbi:hypothetical protein ACFC26_23875 [Kitasatospora purpeofusca]|uniref:hypothetical protein n=1 Tax=Kitasatospora purpeofusca TaxID=67352 RepID=UPI0035E2B403
MSELGDGTQHFHEGQPRPELVEVVNVVAEEPDGRRSVATHVPGEFGDVPPVALQVGEDVAERGRVVVVDVVVNAIEDGAEPGSSKNAWIMMSRDDPTLALYPVAWPST